MLGVKKYIIMLGERPYIRTAIAERADLSAFREKPDIRVLSGVFAILLSYVIGWPAVAALSVLAVKWQNPWIAAIGGPLTYGLSHLVFLLGMYLAGAAYSMIFLRWLSRVSMERLLTWALR